MKHKIVVIHSVLHMCYEIACAGLLFALMEVVLIKQEIHLYLMAVTAGLFVYSCLIREVINRYIVILLLHILPCLLVFLLPISTETKWVYLCVPCYLFFASVKGTKKMAHNQIDDIPWPSFMLCLTAYLLSDYLKNNTLHMLSYVTALILLVLYLALVYTDGIKRYLDATKEVSSVPIRQILSVNTVMIGTIIICLFVSLALGELFDFKKVLALFGQAILGIVRVMAMGLGLFFHYISFWFRGGDTEEEQPYQDFEDGNAPAFTKSVAETLEPVLYVGLLCFVVWIAYKLIGRFVRFLMSRKVAAKDVVEILPSKMTPGFQKEKKKKKSVLSSRTERARKYYKDCIWRYRYDITLDKRKTGREIKTELKENNRADVSEITACYEEIRYGDVKPDKKLLQKMRKLSNS